MATLDTSKSYTLVELAKRKLGNGNEAVVAEVLNADNPIIQDAPWVEANDTFSHKVVRRLSLPAGSWRRLNAGVAVEASQTLEAIETIGMLETYSEVDKDLVDAAAQPRHFRTGEAKAFIEGLAQTWTSTVFYGDSGKTPEQFTGLAPRLAATSQGNVYSAGGSGGDTTSIYVVQWGETKAGFVYPKGAGKLGIAHHDKGQVTLEDANGNLYEGYRDHFQLKCGMYVKDERSIARIANIETSGATNTFDEDLLIAAINNLPMEGKDAVIYVNATIRTQMDIKLKDKTNVNFTVDNGLGGIPLLRFRGIPVRKCDAIVNNETAIS